MHVTAAAEKYMLLKGHVGAVYAISPADGPSQVFTAGSDGVIARWDVENGTSAGALARIQGPVFSLMYHAEAKRLWAGREDGGLHVLDTSERKELKLFKNHDKGVFGILRAGNTVFTSGGDGTVAVMDAEKLETIRVFRAGDQKVRGLHYDNAKRLLYTASADGMVRAFDHTYNIPVSEWKAHDDAANVITPLPDGTLMTGGRDARLKIWDVRNGEPTLLQNIPAHNYAIYKIGVFAELGIFITCSRDKTAKIWSLKTKEVLCRISRTTTGGHRNSVNDFTFFPEKRTLITVGDDAAIMVWKLILNELRIEN